MINIEHDPSLYKLNPYAVQQDNAHIALDKTESSAIALGRVFTDLTGKDRVAGVSTGIISNIFKIKESAQNFEVEAEQARKAIQAVRLTEPDSAAALDKRYGSIVDKLYLRVSEEGLKAIKVRETLASDKLRQIQQKNAVSVSVDDKIELQDSLSNLRQLAETVTDVMNIAVKASLAARIGAEEPKKKLSLEALVLLISKTFLDNVNHKTGKEFKELKDRQSKVSDLHRLHKSINAITTSKGEIDFSKNEEIKAQIKKAKERGLEVDEKKTSYNKEERERLVENIRMSVEDLNVQNDMQLQTITRLMNERYEAYQMARSVMKPLDDDKKQKARAIAGK